MFDRVPYESSINLAITVFIYLVTSLVLKFFAFSFLFSLRYNPVMFIVSFYWSSSVVKTQFSFHICDGLSCGRLLPGLPVVAILASHPLSFVYLEPIPRCSLIFCCLLTVVLILSHLYSSKSVVRYFIITMYFLACDLFCAVAEKLISTTKHSSTSLCG